ncbi:MFS transporter [Gordonia humi]|uniref:MFS family permease n=1 Tax=Gordonia humi TaxID=686429 RepID=A0A840ER38_9ACTN|nr:MFS transporter [Gordonia humi]MBB4133991.1 MFS family permease [Gordonia humi]
MVTSLHDELATHKVGNVERRPTLSRTAGFWLVVFLILTGLLGSYALTPLYPIYQDRWGFSDLTLSLAFACYALGTVFALIAVGSLSDRIGRRNAFVPALVGVIVSVIVLATANGVPMLLIGRSLQGMATGIVTGTAGAALIDLAPGGQVKGVKRAALANTASIAAGSALGPLVSGFLVAHTSWPTLAPYLLVMVLLVIGLAGVFFLPAVPHSHAVKPRRETLIPRAPENRGTFVLACLGTVVASASMALYAAFGTPIAHQAHLEGKSTGGLLVFATFAAIGIAQLLFSRLHSLTAMRAGVVCALAGWGVVVTALLMQHGALLVIGSIVTGTGCGLAMMGGAAAVNHIAHSDRRAETISLYLTIMFISLAIPGIGAGALSDTIGLTNTTIVMLVVAAVIAALVLALSRSARITGPLTSR